MRSGRRQSMPSSSIDNCARVSDTVPLSACGQTKRPRSSRFANRHSPSPSHHSSLIRSPRRPRKTKTCPENGFCFQNRLHDRAQSGESSPQIRHAGGDPDLRARRQSDHRIRPSSSRSHAVRICGAFDRTRAWPRSISMMPVLVDFGLGRWPRSFKAVDNLYRHQRLGTCGNFKPTFSI